ncbi:hypothetical protein EJV46_16115 [Roseococcus sp. SYP-B2431]|uniref:hypothetical protein n=1 Tax=Roseococcus sp. SYP-B2431 TaxID=2496640 RepID=UPI00103A9DB9|nr:hypothetical protein [Roseococcus sp. SYP-B2431]TCH97641.1 hypothetical protein EJV46_16115 [Roseococcus sp. SYP-B2431]
MQYADVMQLRPEAQDSASLAGAILRAERARVESLNRVKDLAGQRSAALLTSDDAELQAMEQQAADAQRAADRIAALIEAMRAEMEVASEREKKEQALHLLEGSNRVATAFLTWWREEYPKHAEAIRAGLLLEQQAHSARAVAQAALESTGLNRKSLIYTSAEITGSGSLWSLHMGAAFQLPSLDGTVWPRASKHFEPYWFVTDLRRMDIR